MPAGQGGVCRPEWQNGHRCVRIGMPLELFESAPPVRRPGVAPRNLLVAGIRGTGRHPDIPTSRRGGYDHALRLEPLNDYGWRLAVKHTHDYLCKM